MRKTGRYGYFIRWILCGTCAFDGRHQDTPFFYSKQVWFLLNLSFFIVVYVLGSLHDKRVVYIDRVLVHLVKYVMLHAVIFLMLVSFIDALPPWKAMS